MTRDSVGPDLLLVLILVAINGLFVAAELALVTARRTRVDQLAAGGSPFARIVRSAMERPILFIVGTQIGITLANLILGWVGEPAVVRLIEPLLVAIPGLSGLVPEPLLAGVATAMAFFLITLFTILFGEVLPKSVAISRPERVAMLSVPPVLLFTRLVRPLIWIINGSSELVLSLVRLRPVSGRHAVHSEEEIRALIAESRQAGVVDVREEELVRRVFRFGDKVAREVMVPRTRVSAITVTASLADAASEFGASGVSRLPVYDGDLDNIVGVLTAGDVLSALGRDLSRERVEQLMRPAFYIPESKELSELLPEMREQRTQLAVVLDEFGGTAGILTIEDLLEEVVGEIVSEFGSERRFVHRHTADELLVDAELNLDDLNELWDLSISTAEVDTVGGLIYEQLGRVPKVGDGFDLDDLEFSVRSMRGNAIGTVRIARRKRSEAAAS